LEHPWVEDFIEQCSNFPRGEHDDVDALTQLLVYLQRNRSTLSARDVLRAGESDADVDDEDEGGGRRGGGFNKLFRRALVRLQG